MILDKISSVIDLFLKYLGKLTNLYVDVSILKKVLFEKMSLDFKGSLKNSKKPYGTSRFLEITNNHANVQVFPSFSN